MVRGNRSPVLTARMQNRKEMTNRIFNAFLFCVSIETLQFFLSYFVRATLLGVL